MNAISLLTEHHFPQAFALEQRAHLFPWSEATFLASQGGRYLNLCLTHEDKLIAFAITQVVLDEATLFNLAVDPDFQRQGRGEQLLNGVIEQIAARGVNMLWLEVRASNQAAIGLYEKMAFNEVSRRRDYYPAAGGKKEDAIVMALTL